MPIMDRRDDSCLQAENTLADEQNPVVVEDAISRRRLISGGLSAAPILLAMHSRSALATALCESPSRMMSGNMSASNPDGSCTPGKSPDYWAKPKKFGEWPSGKAPSLKKCTGSAKFEKKSGGGCKLKTASSWTSYTDEAVPLLSRFTYTVPTSCPSSGMEYAGGPQSASPATMRVYTFGATFAEIFVDTNMGFVPKLPTFVNDSTVPAIAALRAVSLWELLVYPTWGFSPAQLDLARCCIAAYLNAMYFGDQYPVTAQQAIDMWRDGRVGDYCAVSSCTTNWGPTQIIWYLSQTWS